MRVDRRRFLTLGTSTLAVTALPGCTGSSKDTGDSGADTPVPASSRAPEPEPWTPGGVEDTVAFPCAVVIGDATSEGGMLSCVTTLQVVDVAWTVAEGTTWGDEQVRPGLVVPATGTLAVVLDGLPADHAVSVVVRSPDGTVRSRATRFRTAMATGTPLRQVSFGASSCFAANRPWPTLSHAGAQALDFFGLLGDTVYADDAQDDEGYRRYWRSALAERGMRDLMASTSILATWDDHEVDNNWSRANLPAAKIDAARTTFREHLPQGRGPDGDSIWRSISWGDVAEVFVLDCRGERDGERYVSVAQMEWLKERLATSGARFKIILNSVPITDLSAIFQAFEIDDRWDGYPTQRAEILTHIVEQGIEGVLWVTGDVHYGQVGRVDPEGGFAHGLHEVFVGPGGSQVNVLAAIFPGNPQYEQIVPFWNWCRFDLDPGLGTVRVRHFGDDGSMLSDHLLRP